jgi:hypothetical protein
MEIASLRFIHLAIYIRFERKDQDENEQIFIIFGRACAL